MTQKSTFYSDSNNEHLIPGKPQAKHRFEGEAKLTPRICQNANTRLH